MKRPIINITPAERAGHVLMGLLGAIGGFVVIGGASEAVGVVLAALLALAGVDLMVTGALGHCPPYGRFANTRRFANTQSSLRKPA